MTAVGRGSRLVALALAGAALAAACAPGGPSASGGPITTIFPVIISPVLAVGENRILYSVLDAATSRPAALRDRRSTIRLVPADDAPAGAGAGGAEVEATFLWAVDDLSGLYVAHVQAPHAGTWQLEVFIMGDRVHAPAVRIRVEVLERRPGVAVGTPVPRVDNPTLATIGGDPRRLTTDVVPEPRFYEQSVAGLLDAHRPFAIMFGSPGFCTNGSCGPAMARFKAAARANKDVAFVHLESYAETWQDGRLQPALDAGGNLQPSAAILIWGMPTETSVVVVGADGRATAVFDVLIAPGEVEAALAALR